MSTQRVRVTRKRVEADGIVSFEFQALTGQSLPSFSAGAHIDVYVRPGVVRQYSLCNDPTESGLYRIAVLRDPATRGGSAAMHDTVVEGGELLVGEPRNLFPLVPAASALLVAGGIGVTPLICMAEVLARTGSPFRMHYCTRSEGVTAFKGRIAESAFRDSVVFHHDDGPPHQRFDPISELSDMPADTHLYVCGPTGFIEYVLTAARARNWTEDRLHCEYFGAAPVDGRGNGGFMVRLASSGATYRVPADKTVSAVLAENGIKVPLSCKQGMCGTCITGVLEGVCDHRDQFFTEDEKARHNQFTPCCSRAISALLVLDL